MIFLKANLQNIKISQQPITDNGKTEMALFLYFVELILATLIQLMFIDYIMKQGLI